MLLFIWYLTIKLYCTSNTFADKPGGQRSAQAPSFIIQEEFDRYSGDYVLVTTKDVTFNIITVIAGNFWGTKYSWFSNIDTFCG